MMYPKVKVREQIEGGDHYSYESYDRSSVQSLKAFEWLSLDHFSASDKRPRPVVRISSSPTPGFQVSKVDDKNNTKKAVMCENKKKTRAFSAPRPRAVLSSPDNDEIFTSKTRIRRELLLALKSHNLCQRHTKCKIFPSSSSKGVNWV